MQFDKPKCCPICSNERIEAVFPDLMVTGKAESGNRVFQGLTAYMCLINGHIFFVRVSDLVAA
jgi:hypothetical protein